MAAISAGVGAHVQRFANLFTGPALSLADWAGLLRQLFPEVQRQYAQAADLGRTFYDSQRELHNPGLPRHQMLRSELQWKWFVKNMEIARKGMSQADSPQIAVTRTAMAAVREVEMAGRRQIIGAVKNDPVPQTVGWARVATGRETCAWCLMLISRGPEYLSAENAGIELDDETVVDLWLEAGQDLAKFREETEDSIEQWHIGCDCLVVPVFDKDNWVGRAAQKRAEQLWIDAGREASALIREGKARTSNTNKETINALRRRLARGEITIPSYALVA